MFDNNDDSPPTVPSSAGLITPCPAPPTHLSNLIDLAPAYLASQISNIHFFIVSSITPTQTWTFLHNKLSVGSENLDSEENKTIKEDRYHPDMSQTRLHIEFLRGCWVDGTRQGVGGHVLSWSSPSPSHQACPRRLSSPFMGLGLASYVRPGWLREARAASLTSLHPPGPPQSGPRWRRGVRVAWPVWHGEGQDASHWSRPRPRGPAPAPGMGPRQGL